MKKRVNKQKIKGLCFIPFFGFVFFITILISHSFSPYSFILGIIFTSLLLGITIATSSFFAKIVDEKEISIQKQKKEIRALKQKNRSLIECERSLRSKFNKLGSTVIQIDKRSVEVESRSRNLELVGKKLSHLTSSMAKESEKASNETYKNIQESLHFSDAIKLSTSQNIKMHHSFINFSLDFFKLKKGLSHLLESKGAIENILTCSEKTTTSSRVLCFRTTKIIQEIEKSLRANPESKHSPDLSKIHKMNKQLLSSLKDHSHQIIEMNSSSSFIKKNIQQLLKVLPHINSQKSEENILKLINESSKTKDGVMSIQNKLKQMVHSMQYAHNFIKKDVQNALSLSKITCNVSEEFIKIKNIAMDLEGYTYELSDLLEKKPHFKTPISYDEHTVSGIELLTIKNYIIESFGPVWNQVCSLSELDHRDPVPTHRYPLSDLNKLIGVAVTITDITRKELLKGLYDYEGRGPIRPQSASI